MTNKKTILISALGSLGIIASLTLGSLYFIFLHRYKGNVIIDEWDESQAFDINNITTINKDPNKDFKILNFADIQMCDLEDIPHMSKVKDELTYLVNEVKPDLITLTGDQTWSNENLISLTSLIRWLDEFKIPYAPVFGNHDFGNDNNNAVLNKNACSELYEKGKYSLFKRGPSNLSSQGNYVINIKEGNKIFRTIYMLDVGENDEISEKQLAWFKWNINGIKDYNGDYSKGMVFFHKPLYEHFLACYKYEKGDTDVEAILSPLGFPGSSVHQEGFFNLCQDSEIEDIVVGHHHWGSYSIKYQNIRLTLATKTGELGGYYEDDETYLNGATYFTLTSSDTSVDRILVDKNTYHFN